MRSSLVVVVTPVVAPAAALVVAVVVALAPAARAASAACTSDAQCTAPQVCRLSEGACVFEAVDAASLTSAVTAANADAARDVICIGAANPADGADPTTIAFDTAAATDATLGPLAFPAVVAPLTVEGCGVDADHSVLDDNADLRMFLVQPGPLDVAVDLVLKNLTLTDARPGLDGAGNVVGGGAIHVTAAATTGGAPSTVTATGVVFHHDGNGAGGDAPVVLAGGPATFTNCTFENGNGALAGAILASGGKVTVTGGTFTDNHSDGGPGAISAATDLDLHSAQLQGNNGAVGAVDITAATHDDGSGAQVDVAVSIAACTFDGNHGHDAGAVRSLGTTLLANDTFTNNRTGQGQGGAALARNLTVQSGTFDGNFAGGGGGAVAILDTPPSATVQIGGAFFHDNSTGGEGGAILDTGAAIAVNLATFESNSASAGGALALKDLVDRNGATTPDATITGAVFRQNVARPSVTITAGQPSLDEKGNQTGSLSIGATGKGAALLLDGAGLVDAQQSCIIGNNAAAVALENAGGTLHATNDWWGASDGPAPAGGGDLPGAGVDTSSPLDGAPDACSGGAFATPDLLFMGASVTTDSAQIGVDYQLLDHARGTHVLNGATGQILPDLRLGRLDVDAVGVNDDLVEGDETFTFTLEPCSGDCGYDLNGQTTIQMTIADDGDGGGEGEGEGEGGCDEALNVSPSPMLLPDTGKESEASLTVQNASPCAVDLRSPFVQKGASQGFAVKPVPLAQLHLEPGKQVVVIVTYTPPEESPDAPPQGTLLLETAGGTLKEVPLSLAPGGCSCRSTSDGAPFVAALLAWLGRRRRSDGRQAAERATWL